MPHLDTRFKLFILSLRIFYSTLVYVSTFLCVTNHLHTLNRNGVSNLMGFIPIQIRKNYYIKYY